jgi:hypothetical protein
MQTLHDCVYQATENSKKRFMLFKADAKLQEEKDDQLMRATTRIPEVNAIERCQFWFSEEYKKVVEILNAEEAELKAKAQAAAANVEAPKEKTAAEAKGGRKPRAPKKGKDLPT